MALGLSAVLSPASLLLIGPRTNRLPSGSGAVTVPTPTTAGGGAWIILEVRQPMAERSPRLAECIPSAPPRFGDSARLSMIGRGSVGWEILCLREELVLERGSLETELRPPEPDVERLNHFVGCVKSLVNPFEGDTERGVLRKLAAGDEGDGVDASGGLSVFEPCRRGAMGSGNWEWTWRGGNGEERQRMGVGVDVDVDVDVDEGVNVREDQVGCRRFVPAGAGCLSGQGWMRTERFTERSASDWMLQMPFDHIRAGHATS
ncbi:hypothetical protein LXA43DRAFT_1016929 [Ganoderma leucocontextum]|nr:hypothetical protein LXA43DRAFT_1016929 [Ganoderma leucocontextum]